MTTSQVTTPEAPEPSETGGIGENTAVEPAAEAPGTDPAAGVERGFRRADALVGLGFVLAAVVLLGGQWLSLGTRYLSYSVSDQNQWEWYAAFVAHAVGHGENPLFTTLQNFPLGVNTMANTFMFGVTIPLTPVTLLAGPTVSWALLLTVGLSATAFGWYWAFSRHLVTHRSAAVLGGAVTGFAPPVISHANAHPNWVVAFVMPALVLATVRIATGTRPVRDGVVLGLLVVLQVFIGEELLLIGATSGAIVAVLWFWIHPEQAARMWRPLARGVGVAVAVALVLLAGPLWWQFAGPQTYHGLPHSAQGNALDAFTAFPTLSLGGVPEQAAKLSINRTEENAFFGWPLVVLLVVIVVIWWRDAWFRVLGLGALVLCVLSLGESVTIGQSDTGIPAPWALLQYVPLFDTMLTTRFTLGALPMIAAMLALATDRVLSTPDPVGPRGRIPLRGLWVGVLVAALLPIVPVPLPTGQREPVPAFFTDGAWRSFVDPGGTVVPVPLVDTGEVQPLRWQVASGLGWSMPGGYFVGPGDDGYHGTWGSPTSVTGELLSTIRRNKGTVVIDEGVRAQVRDDLRRWHASVLVLVPGDRSDALFTAVNALVGPRSRVVDGAVVWDVRDLTR